VRIVIPDSVDMHDHIILSHRGTAHPKPGVTISNFVPGSMPTTDDFLSSIPSNERVLMDAFVAEHCLSRKIPDEQDVFLAVVWMTSAERSVFCRFPFVIKIDITFATNCRGIPLLTITGKTSDNEVFTVLRAGYQTNRRGSFVGSYFTHCRPFSERI
jgi:hypothetical protein